MLQGAEGIDLGAQDCSDQESGAYTGQVSADMLIDIGAEYVIVGHSERREYCGEDNALLKAKIEQAHAAGLVAIYCVGESEAQREAGQEKDVVSSQLAEGLPEGATAENTVVAYEPVWAIGTGKVATPGDVKDMHGFIRERFAGRILYGGSMKPGNAEELLSTPNVDGGLIGGASLSAEDFLAIASLA
jgi:triosephosphate isomerase